MEHLAEGAAARPARLQGRLGQALEHLDVLPTTRARVFVRRHTATIVAKGGVSARFLPFARGNAVTADRSTEAIRTDRVGHDRTAGPGYAAWPRRWRAPMKVRKAVIPAAGLGTRFLPATKAQPKEMLPVVDKPAIQYVVEEACRAGIEDILIVTGRGKRSIEDHFDRSIELEHYLETKGKFDELKEVREISEMATIHYIRQRDPLGLGHAVAIAQGFVAGEPFAVLLGDDIMAPDSPLLNDMLRVYERYGRSILAAMEVSRDEISLYGAITPEFVEDRLARVTSIVEKPSPEDAPSNLAAIGRYILTPEIFDRLRGVEPGKGGEIQLTDAINALAQDQAVYAWTFEGGRYDTGNKLDYLKATIELAIDREDLGDALKRYLVELVQRKKLL
jgi:UTP--glucose-1-phosphate uridylyltransferase